MAGLGDLANVWNTIKEVDLRPIRQEAERELVVAILSEREDLAHGLAEHLRRDPLRLGADTQTPVLLLPFEAAPPPDLDLLLYLLDGADPALPTQLDKALQRSLGDKKCLVLVNTTPNSDVKERWLVPNQGGQTVRLLHGAFDDQGFLRQQFVPLVLRTLPQRQTGLARAFPLFRETVARELINDACVSNAAYSLSTGLAEIVPGLNIPLNIADMIVLTKAQGFLVYRLGMALGLSTRWQDYVAEFGGVLGGGFLWRQIARSLIGLIPAWGIIPKVAVAYSGTYAVGQTVYQWYLTGRHLPTEQIGALYRQAFEQGKQVARDLVARLPKGKPKAAQPKALPAPRRGWFGSRQQICPDCGRKNAADANFCQNCGRSFGILLEGGLDDPDIPPAAPGDPVDPGPEIPLEEA